MRDIDPDLYLRNEREDRAAMWDSEPAEDNAPDFCANCEAEMTDEDLVVDDSECKKCVEKAWTYRREQGRGSVKGKKS